MIKAQEISEIIKRQLQGYEAEVDLKEAGRVYVVAYINGTKGQAQKLDPIRESEGVGRGTVAYGPGVTKLAKALNLTPQ